MTTTESPQIPSHTLTVYVAAPGTPHVRDGVTTYSTPGHLYWSISDGTTTSGYGFGPAQAGDMHGPGKVSQRDHLEYQNPMYERTMAISADQYAKLKTFGQQAVDGMDPRFDTSSARESYGLGNNCVDFTWKALEIAGIDRRRPYAEGENPNLREMLLGPNDQFREGRLRPVDNARDLEKLQDPIPGHPANGTIRREAPELDGLNPIRRLLSESDPRQPEHPDHDRYQRISALVRAEDTKLGRTSDEASANLTASLTLLSKRDGVDPVHLAFSHEDKARGIAAGQNVFLFDGDPVREPWYQRTTMPTAEAVRTPAQDSFRELAQVNERLSLQRQQDEALALRQPAVAPAESQLARSM